MRFSIKKQSLSGAVNTILGDNYTSLNPRGIVHSSGTSPSLHQAVTWSLLSPFYNDTLHLTGVYIFPNEGNLDEFFDTLTAHSNHPCHEPHIYVRDCNAYTAEKIESHITPLDSHALFHRVGDTNPAHSPASLLTTDTTIYFCPKTEHILYSRLQSHRQTPRTSHSHVSSSSKCPSCFSYRSHAYAPSSRSAHLIQSGPPNSTSHLSCPHSLPLQVLERSAN